MQQQTLEHELACGMPLLMFPNNDLPVATADVWVRTGAIDEPADVSGISHFLEHMLFKGTEQWGLGEIERAIEGVGGVCNAATGHDYTHYYVTLPAKDIGLGVAMLAEMVRNSTLDATELEKERLVILEEYRRKQDHPVGVLYERLYQEVFEQGVYHETIIGSEATINAIDRPRMLEYFHQRYTPESMTLIVTGKFDPAEIIARAEEAFAGFTRPLQGMTDYAPTRYGRNKQIHLEKQTGGEIYIAFAFPAPGTKTMEQVLPLDVAQFILGSGRAAQLNQSLHEKKHLCSSITAYFPTHLHESLFVIVATCKPEQIDALREALLAELRKFVSAPPEAAAMQRALRLLASGHRFGMETSGGLSSSIGYYYTLTGSTKFQDKYLDYLKGITPEAVQQAALDCFPPDRLRETMVELSIGPALEKIAPMADSPA